MQLTKAAKRYHYDQRSPKMLTTSPDFSLKEAVHGVAMGIQIGAILFAICAVALYFLA
jgi:hypothetical protein